MQTSKSNNLFVSQSAIRTWSPAPSQTGPTPIELCDDSFERQRLEERLTQVQRDARCVRRAVRVMVFLTAFAVVGLGHSTVFLPFWPQTMDQYLMQWPIKAHCALGLASLSCAIVFSALRLLYRRELNWCVDQCQRLTIQTIQPPDRRIIPLTPGLLHESALREQPVSLDDAA